MKCTETKLKGAYIINFEPKTDERGVFARTWDKKIFDNLGLNTNLVQGNMSMNLKKGTLRGMHFQAAPHAETKLVLVSRGAIYDVIIDLRQQSKTYKQWVGVELTSDNYTSLYVPEGFAHGFLTLTDDTEILYWVTAYYDPASDRGVRWSDPAFAINWPGKVKHISTKDAAFEDYTL